MIEINLLPGAASRQKRRGPAFAAGGLTRPTLPSFDRTLSILVGLWVLALAGTAWMHFGSSSRLAQLEVDVQAAQRDSARLQNLRSMNDSLRTQIEDIGTRLTMLQEIDAGRYTWSHVLDEISRALPQYTWLVNVTEAAPVAGAGSPRIKLEGRTGNTFALAKFMQDLEVSPFLQGVTLMSQTQTSERDRTVYAFVLEMGFQEPTPDVIETQPLFAAGAGSLQLTDTMAGEGEGN